MKFYNSRGPNPRMVRMFMAEKGIDIPKVEIDLLAGENRREPYTKLNPAGQMPSIGKRSAESMRGSRHATSRSCSSIATCSTACPARLCSNCPSGNR